MELRIYRVRINRARPVIELFSFDGIQPGIKHAFNDLLMNTAEKMKGISIQGGGSMFIREGEGMGVGHPPSEVEGGGCARSGFSQNFRKLYEIKKILF